MTRDERVFLASLVAGQAVARVAWYLEQAGIPSDGNDAIPYERCALEAASAAAGAALMIVAQVELSAAEDHIADPPRI